MQYPPTLLQIIQRPLSCQSSKPNVTLPAKSNWMTLRDINMEAVHRESQIALQASSLSRLSLQLPAQSAERLQNAKFFMLVLFLVSHWWSFQGPMKQSRAHFIHDLLHFDPSHFLPCSPYGLEHSPFDFLSPSHSPTARKIFTGIYHYLRPIFYYQISSSYTVPFSLSGGHSHWHPGPASMFVML